MAFSPGTEKQFCMTVCMLTSDETEAGLLASAEADSLAEGRANLAGQSERQPFLGQNSLVLLDEQLAGRGVEDLVAALYAENDREGTEQLAILRGKAEDAFSYTGGFTGNPPYALTALLNNATAHSYVSRATLKNVENASQSIGRTALLPILVMEDTPRAAGMAVLKDYKLAGELSEDEARGAKWIAFGAQHDSLTVQANGRSYGVELYAIQPHVTARVRGGQVCFDVGLSFALAVQTRTRGENQAAILQAAAREVEDRARQAIFRAQELSADFLNLAPIYLNHDGAARAQYRESWCDSLKDFSFSVHAEGQVLS